MPSPKPQPRPIPSLKPGDHQAATSALNNIWILTPQEIHWVLDRLPVSLQREILAWADNIHRKAMTL
jgi:hypothetical protein